MASRRTARSPSPREFAASETRPPIAVSADESAFWLYSSGSTGQPKGVRHVHGSLKHTADTYGAEVLRIRSDDVVYSAAKMFFAYGLGNAMTFPLSVGATTILYSGRPTPEAVFDILERFKPTVFCGVPTLYAALDAQLESGKARVSAPLRCCISAGEALPEEVGAKWRRFTGVDILDGVGSTEMLHIFLSNRDGEVVYGTSGVAVPGYDIRLVDEQGQDVAEGEIGEMLVRGASAAADYWNRRGQSRSTFQGHWTHTGDKYEKLARRALPLLRAHRRHVQGRRHLALAVRGRAGALRPPQRSRGRGRARARRGRPRKAEGLRGAEARRRRPPIWKRR